MNLVEPSERNFEVFVAVEFQRMSWRGAAALFDISPTRVGQIVEQVRQWYRATTPEWIDACAGELRPAVACRVYEEQIHHCAVEAMNAWKASQGEFTISRKQGLSSATVVTKRGCGEPKYLLLTLKLSEAQRDARIRTAVVIDKLREKRAELPRSVREGWGEGPPPAGGCAPESLDETPSAEDESDVVDLNDDTHLICNEEPEIEHRENAPPITLPTPERSRLQKRHERSQRRAAARQRKKLRVASGA